MAKGMGLNVCVVEKDKLGGECLNVGCMPSKGLLEHAKKALLSGQKANPFSEIQNDVDFIRDKKMVKTFEKVKIIKGVAEFVDKHTVKVNDTKVSAKKIFIATGTKPFIPSIDGIEDIEYLTNETIFSLEQVPKSITIIGGGAIGSEIAQAFAYLGSKVTIVQFDEYLVPVGDKKAGKLLESQFKKAGIDILNSRKITRAYINDRNVVIETDKADIISSEKLLIATGRKVDATALKLDNAGIKIGKRGEILANKYLLTNNKHIYAVGDCNGNIMLSHAAMHQGMIGLMNSMSPFKQDFRKFPIPWTVFTDPQVSHVGMTKKELVAKNIKFDTIDVAYKDYGAAIIEKKETGFVRVYATKFGKVLGVSIIGDGSGEMINEWTLAIQNNIGLAQIMLTAHSFPTMGFLSKRVAEEWAMKKFENPLLKVFCKLFS
ncbi:MAG: NAD(P)/FAD-dependent oxidoreductase, partial [Candidatus Gastranaerophilales bacterium]|nr:NAD(P)/FAD-dependent oxidoreductase [Candidatus Gastranaerophilales bacterium]